MAKDEKPKVARAEWRPFPGLKIQPPAEELSSEPDIREYQLKRHAHEFEGAPAPEAPRRQVTLDAPLLGGRQNLGTLPYDYADVANRALNMIYGAKTRPFYSNPYTAPIAASLDAYEAGKRIQENPASISSYTGLIPIARSASPIAGLAGAAGGAAAMSAGSGAAASDDGERPSAGMEGARSPVFRQGDSDVMQAMRLAHGMNEGNRFAEMLGAGRDTLPMRISSYGQRYNPATGRLDSPESKGIGFAGPLTQGDHVVSEYSSDRDFQYPTIYLKPAIG